MLSDLFGITLEKARLLAIEPPFWCDYGSNIEFKGGVVRISYIRCPTALLTLSGNMLQYMNFNATVL